GKDGKRSFRPRHRPPMMRSSPSSRAGAEEENEVLPDLGLLGLVTRCRIAAEVTVGKSTMGAGAVIGYALCRAAENRASLAASPRACSEPSCTASLSNNSCWTPMKFLDRFRKNAPNSPETPAPVPEAPPAQPPIDVAPVPAPREEPPVARDWRPPTVALRPTEEPRSSLFERLKSGLKRTSSTFSEGLGNLFLGKKEIDDELIEELETQLLLADVGIDATEHIMGNLAQRVSRKELADSGALYRALQEELKALIEPCSIPLVINPAHKTYVILMVGVNGVGKTTTIGKLAKRFQDEGKSVLMAAGDPIRAAA